MYTSICLPFFSLFFTLATAQNLGHPSNGELPLRPISFSSPSQHPILQPPNDLSPSSGIINVPFCTLDEPIRAIPVTFSISSQVCGPLLPNIPYIIADLSERLLEEHINGISFLSSTDAQTLSPPIYLGANITEQLYRLSSHPSRLV
ncbi:uncharacterized protein LY89DRAFT_687327 [Mollisia scopiformis]|uniref:Uncharacterized protein n=1 Tax=Mollisia scopiformis TaxID=149040 RepID=A0A194X1I5_MOLSC|nr:uncharacterized protein LY89DRAFT_687327 [Mollisia scopiformis]KUJ14058.1 hypothetical protein LY89DRAFT_687327 [Mollisia scopiformis]